MDSLTTAYIVCILIGSIGSIAGAFVGNRMSPIPSSAKPAVEPTIEPVSSAIEETPDPVHAPYLQSTAQTVPVTPSTV